MVMLGGVSLFAAGCSQQDYETGYVPEESEVFAFEGGSLFADFYREQAETFVTGALIFEGGLIMYAVGLRDNGNVLVFTVMEDQSTLTTMSREKWEESNVRRDISHLTEING